MSKERQLYIEKYRKGAMVILPGRLPVLKHVNEGCKVVDAHIQACGVVERDGKRLEFHDIRVYIEV